MWASTPGLFAYTRKKGVKNNGKFIPHFSRTAPSAEFGASQAHRRIEGHVFAKCFLMPPFHSGVSTFAAEKTREMLNVFRSKVKSYFAKYTKN